VAIPRFPDERLGMLPEKFFTALGHLHYAFTSLEVQMASVVNQYITVGYDSSVHWPMQDKVSAILGGLRMETAKDTINRLLRVSEAPQEVQDFVKRIFQQIGEIQYFRNRLAHYHTGRWLRKPGQFVNTDMEVAREKTKTVTFSFSYDALEAARHDLHLISRLIDDLFDFEVESFDLQIPAWQFKSTMLIKES